MTSSRHLARHFSRLTHGASLTTLIVVASLLALPSDRSQAADNRAVGGPGVSVQMTGSAGETKAAATATGSGLKSNETQAQKKVAAPASEAQKKSDARVNEALKVAHHHQQQQRTSTPGAGSGGAKADQARRIDQATRQRLEQAKPGPASAVQCPHPPCNVMPRRAPSAGPSAMDRLGGGPRPAVGAAKAGSGVKASTAASASGQNQMKMIELQEEVSKRQRALQMQQNIQQKQQENSGTVIRNMR
ncbi:MAG: hypothetical protein K2Y27_16115 [Xanthobacteraceae bacterium]|nr:hypothetical protein [Xanthobacteraceae bacterium]